MSIRPPLQVVMLTGDNPLTACHIAKELKITQRKLLVLTRTGDDEWVWQSVGGATTVPFETRPPELGERYDLCVTGDVSHLSASLQFYLASVIVAWERG